MVTIIIMISRILLKKVLEYFPDQNSVRREYYNSWDLLFFL